MIYFAHRGYNIKYPENTLLAFDKAISAGATAVEFDVHKTKDGQLVVIHDENIKRTYKGNGLIKNFTLKELKAFVPKNKDFKDNKLCKIPTLDEVLEMLKPHNMLINIELKTDEIQYENIEEDVINTIKNHTLEDNVIISSFNHDSLEICKKVDPSLRIGLLFHYRINNIVEYATKIGAYSLHPDFRLLSEKFIKKAHANNLKIFTYTVNSPSTARNLQATGCDGIFTDDVKKFLDNENL